MSDLKPYRYVVYTDGASDNPGRSTSACVIVDRKTQSVMSFAEHIGSATNNIAEYSAVIIALRHLTKNSMNGSIILSDSKLVVEQINGNWNCNDGNLAQLRAVAVSLMRDCNAHISWVPRQRNKMADAVAEFCYRREYISDAVSAQPKQSVLFTIDEGD